MLPALLVVKEHGNGLIKPIDILTDLIDFTATKPFLSIAVGNIYRHMAVFTERQ